MAPKRSSCSKLPCHHDDAHWNERAEALSERGQTLLRSHNLIEENEAVAFDDHAVPFVYPTLEVGAEDKADRLQLYLQRFTYLYLLGPKCPLRYTHVHNLYARAKELARSLAASPRENVAQTAP